MRRDQTAATTSKTGEGRERLQNEGKVHSKEGGERAKKKIEGTRWGERLRRSSCEAPKGR